MPRHFLFLSYKRDPGVTPAVARFHLRIKAELGSYGVEPFFDQKSIEAGDDWETTIDDFLAKTTLFVAFISIDFWLSSQCRRELDIALQRYERHRMPKLLFVLTDRLSPADLSFDEHAAADVLRRSAPVDDSTELIKDTGRCVKRVKSLGDFNFLGPYDQNGSGALVRLRVEDPFQVNDQLAQLVQNIKKLGVLRHDQIQRG